LPPIIYTYLYTHCTLNTYTNTHSYSYAYTSDTLYPCYTILWIMYAWISEVHWIEHILNMR